MHTSRDFNKIKCWHASKEDALRASLNRHPVFCAYDPPPPRAVRPKCRLHARALGPPLGGTSLAPRRRKSPPRLGQAHITALINMTALPTNTFDKPRRGAMPHSQQRC